MSQDFRKGLREPEPGALPVRDSSKTRSLIKSNSKQAGKNKKNALLAFLRGKKG